jgi:uroporphyrinogen decarboxylase
MTGKQILLSAVRGQPTPRPAWLPLVGIHGGHLIGRSARDYLTSADTILAGLTRAAELYRPDGLPALFDLRLEAEVLGCELGWSQQDPPCIMSHPLGSHLDPDCLFAFDLAMGRYPVVLEVMRRFKAELGDTIALYGLITGPLTLATHLRGNAIFLDVFDNQAELQRLLDLCADVARQTAAAYLVAGADVIAMVDPLTSQISPQHFAEFITPRIRPLFESIRAQGGLSSLLVCGNATRNLDAMCQTACDSLSVDETICLETLRGLARRTGKGFGGNLRLASALLRGNTDDAKLDAIRCIDIGGRDGFVLTNSCELPYATPANNVQAVCEMVHSEYRRQLDRTTITARSAVARGTVDLPDFEQPDVVYVDVVTLDSAARAACHFMLTAARRAATHAAARTIVREHPVSSRRGIAMMMRLGVEQIPAICIDGEVAFSQVIPDAQTLGQAIDAAASRKQEACR